MKRKAAVYGAGNKAFQICSILKKYKGDIEVCYAVEGKILEKVGTRLCLESGRDMYLDIISVPAMIRMYREHLIDIIIFPGSYHIFDIVEIEKICLENGVRDEDLYVVPADMFKKEILEKEEVPQILTQHNQLCQLSHLDIHILDDCNIGCKGCAHFSPLVEGTVRLSADEYTRNMAKLKELIPSICNIAVLGGEPLLHPDLSEMLHITRKNYPYANIVIVTNGILLQQMEEELIEQCRREDIGFNLSLYPAWGNKLEEWQKFLRKNKLRHKISYCGEFERRLAEKPIFHGEKTTQRCGHDMCLRGNLIGRCAMALFSDYFNHCFPGILPDSPGIDIFKEEDGTELIQKLSQPLPLCSHCCARDFHYEKWELLKRGGAKKEDWFIPLNLKEE